MAYSTRALSSQRRRTVKRAFLQEDSSFYFNLKSFSFQVQQKVFLTLVSDVFLNLSFDLPVVSPFRVPEQVGSVTFDHASILVRFNSKKSGCFLCSFALKSQLFCLQILIRCSQKKVYGTEEHDISQKSTR